MYGDLLALCQVLKVPITRLLPCNMSYEIDFVDEEKMENNYVYISTFKTSVF